jgi:hypothetical protein
MIVKRVRIVLIGGQTLLFAMELLRAPATAKILNVSNQIGFAAGLRLA